MSELEQSNVTNCNEQHQNPAHYTSTMLLDEEVGNLKRKLSDHHHVELEDGVKEDSDSRSEQSKQQKRVRSAEVHNLNERLRRQRLKEKIKSLQELIPNCSKRDKSSTFDDAIKYIKTLQYQVQVMSMGAGYPPQTMLPHPHSHPQQQILNSAPFLTTSPPGNEINYGIGTGTGMRMSTIFPSLDFSMSQMGMPNNCLLPSSAASGMSSNFTCPLASIESHGSKSASQGPMSASSQGPIQSTTRVLPSKIVQPHHSKKVMDYGCSHSGSNEGSSSSTEKWKNPLFQTVISLLEDADGDDEGEP